MVRVQTAGIALFLALLYLAYPLYCFTVLDIAARDFFDPLLLLLYAAVCAAYAVELCKTPRMLDGIARYIRKKTAWRKPALLACPGFLLRRVNRRARRSPRAWAGLTTLYFASLCAGFAIYVLLIAGVEALLVGRGVAVEIMGKQYGVFIFIALVLAGNIFMVLFAAVAMSWAVSKPIAK